MIANMLLHVSHSLWGSMHRDARGTWSVVMVNMLVDVGLELVVMVLLMDMSMVLMVEVVHGLIKGRIGQGVHGGEA